MSLFEELKRRKVFRLVAAYLVVAWLLVQVVTAIEEPLSLPEWFDTAVIVLLGVGFPIVVILGWIYDVTPEGVVREDGEGATGPVPIDYGKIALGAVLLLGGILLGNFLTDGQDSAGAGSVDRSGVQVFAVGIPGHLTRTDALTWYSAIAPDGRRLVIRGVENGVSQLFVRNLDSLDLVPVAGTGGVFGHFSISPDSESVAFYSEDDGYLKTVSLDGGIATPVAFIGTRQEERVQYIAWGSGGDIVFTEGSYRELRRVSSTGSNPESASSLRGRETHKQPSFVPESDWLVFVVGDGRGSSEDQNEEVAFLSPEGETRMTSVLGSSPKVTPDGNLLYFHRNTVWSVLIDLDTMSISGDPMPVTDDVFYRRLAHYDISAEGSLIYSRESSVVGDALVWVDRSGVDEPTGIEGARLSYPKISPDGDTVAIVEASRYGPDLWTRSLSRRVSSRWTFDEGRESNPTWSPDGAVLYFESTARFDMFRVNINGDGVVERLTNTVEGRYPTDVLPDGRVIVDEWSGSTADGNNIGILEPSVGTEMTHLLASEHRESHPVLSPDGSLLAYMSDSSGTLEIYVRRFPDLDDEVIRVSASGDNWNPRWSGSSDELFYWNRNDLMMYSVMISSDPTLSADSPVALFDTDAFVWEGVTNYDYDPKRDRFLMIKKPLPGATTDEMVLIQNWPARLGR